MAHKICPQCSTPAPIEATFCGSCGRQYRTQFVGAGVADTSAFGADSTPTAAKSADSPAAMRVAILVMSCIVALLILTVTRRSAHDISGSAARSVDAPTQTNRSTSNSNHEADAAEMVRTGADPIEEEAKHVLDRESRRIDSAPPPSAIGPDGRVHLRGGGSITKEQWEDANRRVRNSKLIPDSMPPPPVN